MKPDYVIHVREDILEEEDGPVLGHGLKGLRKYPLCPHLHCTKRSAVQVSDISPKYDN